MKPAIRGAATAVVAAVLTAACGPAVDWTAPLPAEAFRAELKLEENLPPLKTRQVVKVRVVVKNESRLPWPADGITTDGAKVNLAYHWLAPDGAAVVFDGDRTALPKPLDAGKSVTVVATIAAPAAPGTYTLELDLVQEGVTWFGYQGSKTLRRTVTVQ